MKKKNNARALDFVLRTYVLTICFTNYGKAFKIVLREIKKIITPLTD